MSMLIADFIKIKFTGVSEKPFKAQKYVKENKLSSPTLPKKNKVFIALQMLMQNYKDCAQKDQELKSDLRTNA